MNVLIVEDEPKIARVLAEYFERDGFEAAVAHTGHDVVALVREHAYDFVVLDVMLPGKDGLTICRELRVFSDVPILLLTARVEEVDRLLGLELGADDYVCKPFSPREVVTRARTILRRTRSPESTDLVLRHGPVEVRRDRFECRLSGQEIELTRVEFRLLCAMLESPHTVFSRRRLMGVAYDDRRIVSDRTIDSHMRNLRRKLSKGGDERYVKTIYAVGYRFD